jgi:hypothetical protein
MASASYISTPSVFVNQIAGQSTPTLCVQFSDQTNGFKLMVLFFVKNGKLSIKIPYFEGDFCDRVYTGFVKQLWNLGFAVCHYREEISSGEAGAVKKTVMVTLSYHVARELGLNTLDEHKLGFIANKMTGGRVVALEQNGTISLLGKGFPCALDLISQMFPSLKHLTMEGLLKKMVSKKETSVEVVEDFPTLLAKPTVSVQPAPWIKTVAAKAEPVAAKAEPVAVKAEPVAVKAEPVAVKAEPVAVKAEAEDPIVVDVMLLKTLQKELKNAEEQRQQAEVTLKEKEALEKDLKDRVAALKRKMIDLFQ